jgi:predicted ATPase
MAPAGSSVDAPAPEQVRDQLARVLESRALSAAPGLARLLAHTVTETLAGRGAALKEYALGVDVFGRGPSFDPRADSIVRAQARRLRQRLATYYQDEGRRDLVVIALPRGHYVPTFTFNPRVSAGRRGGQGRLPAPRTTLIGRDEDITRLRALLEREDVRLVTLTGAGGSGKTRLALALADAVSDIFPGGTGFVALAAIADPSTVASVIAPVLGLRQTGEKPLVEALLAHVSDTLRDRTLLVVDNFEHLLPARAVIGRLLEASAALTVLVTSRAVLSVYGEHDVSVQPLPVPEATADLGPEALRACPAVALFVERAEAANPAFALSADNAVAVAEVCRRLDGLPLALELAAALASVLPPSAILERLDRPLELLTHGPSDVPDRQRTLRRTLDWSHALLGDAEQRLFRRLAVFAGGCTLESAEAVCNTRHDLGVDTLTGLAALVGKSLLTQTAGDTELRFSMLQTVREYALERLEASGEGELTRKAHAAYALVVAEEGLGALSKRDRLDWLARCEREHDNARAALDYLAATDQGAWAARMAIGLYHFWERREHVAEARQRIAQILALSSTARRDHTHARLMLYLGSLMTRQSDRVPAVALHRQAAELFAELGDPRGVAAQYNSFAYLARLDGDLDAARAWTEQSLAICRELGDRHETAAALSNLATVLRLSGETTSARGCLREARTIFTDLGDQLALAWNANHLGDVARDAGDPAEAERRYRDGLAAFASLGDDWGICRSYADLGRLAEQRRELAKAVELFGHALDGFVEIGHVRGVASVLEGLARVASDRGDAARAFTLLGAADTLRATTGHQLSPGERAEVEAALASAGVPAPEVSRTWREAGQRLTIDAALGLAREVIDPRRAY